MRLSGSTLKKKSADKIDRKMNRKKRAKSSNFKKKFIMFLQMLACFCQWRNTRANTSSREADDLMEKEHFTTRIGQNLDRKGNRPKLPKKPSQRSKSLRTRVVRTTP
ncbi:unnamed protein product, partial [Mesorhabditis belari]|uniref:Uncharacterized protein n=1 Tax=Mesorhabditis belari TaxID=2138241 RepID=A0AAF3FM83_9BILA